MLMLWCYAGSGASALLPFLYGEILPRYAVTVTMQNYLKTAKNTKSVNHRGVTLKPPRFGDIIKK